VNLRGDVTHKQRMDMQAP